MTLERQVSPALLNRVHTYAGSDGATTAHHYCVAPEVAVMNCGLQPVLMDDMVYLWLLWWHWIGLEYKVSWPGGQSNSRLAATLGKPSSQPGP